MSKPPAPKTIFVTQGAYAVSAEPDLVLTSILGSCVATCLYDPVSGVGGMNHFLLPGTDQSSDQFKRYGQELTMSLIADLERIGAERNRLQAKVFGGGRIIAAMVNIGAINAEFAENFLGAARIKIVTKSVGGERARRVRFWPKTGRAQQLLLELISYELDAGYTTSS